jgi:cytochrome c-type biogenesis protein CcmH/NrfG
VLLLAQACVDWTFTFPALTVPFFLLAGIGLADEDRAWLPPRAARPLAAAAIVAAVVLFAPPWIAAKLVRTGLEHRDGADLRWAHRLDPVSVDPWVAEAEIAPSAQAAVAPLERARARAPRSVAVRYLLGSVYWNDGRRADAISEFEAALKLHPHDPSIERALAIVKR